MAIKPRPRQETCKTKTKATDPRPRNLAFRSRLRPRINIPGITTFSKEVICLPWFVSVPARLISKLWTNFREVFEGKGFATRNDPSFFGGDLDRKEMLCFVQHCKAALYVCSRINFCEMLKLLGM